MKEFKSNKVIEVPNLDYNVALALGWLRLDPSRLLGRPLLHNYHIVRGWVLGPVSANKIRVLGYLRDLLDWLLIVIVLIGKLWLRMIVPCLLWLLVRIVHL